MVKAPKTSDLLNDLNPEQVTAVTHGEGPLLIVAGAGTGKTTVITRRIAWLIEQKLAQPEAILALTFTDKASTEMEERVDKLLPLGYVNVPVSTFHAFGERILKDWGLEIGLPNDFKVLTPTEQWMLVRHNLDKFELDYYKPMGNPTRFIHALIQHFSRAKDEEVYPDDYQKFAEEKKLDTGAEEFLKKKKKKKPETRNPKPEKVLQTDDESNESEAVRVGEVARAYHVYQKLLLDNGCLDFGDLINYTLKLFRTRPKVLRYFQHLYTYVLVDEFQDTNYAQYELIKLLGAGQGNITVVGDDDQSIYKFRGASISNILDFKKDYPQSTEVFLTTNYRSYQNILDTAYNFIQLNNPYRLEVKLAHDGKGLSKKLKAGRNGAGEVQYLAYKTAEEEAQGVVQKIVDLQSSTKGVWSDFAILVRANSSASIFLQALKQRGIPFDFVANKGLYSEAIVLDITAYLKLLDNYHESEALYRVLTMEPFTMQPEDMAKLMYVAHKKTISLYESLKQASLILLSEIGLRMATSLLAQLELHATFAREHTAAEVYVKVVEDLGINERVVHPALVREAQYLTTFYQRVQRFAMDTADKSLASFLRYLKLEMEAGEEGQLPTDFEEGPETVKVITVHSAKGLEWPYVFMVQLVDRRFPSTERREPIELPRELIKEVLPEGDVHLQEERRLFYVALTRARDGVWLTRAEDYFGKTTRKPSRFLYELGLVSEQEYTSPSKKIKLEIPQIITKAVARYPLPESFSFSSVSAFIKCPLKYKYHYLLKLPTPGGAALSYGVTIHKTLELFLKMWQNRMTAVQTDLFGIVNATGVALPTIDDLLKLYNESWVDDWYESKQQKEEYRTKKGPLHLKHFYERFVSAPPKTKYLEKFFKIAMGPYKFVGKIDRLDQLTNGVGIVDYKTTAKPPTDLQKVDKDQLIIYQIAAQEFLRETVTQAQYWYLEPNTVSDPFVADKKQVDNLKSEYTKVIEKIISTVEANSFVQADKALGKHECKFRHLE